jgi:hypothetical protein
MASHKAYLPSVFWLVGERLDFQQFGDVGPFAAQQPGLLPFAAALGLQHVPIRCPKIGVRFNRRIDAGREIQKCPE